MSTLRKITTLTRKLDAFEIELEKRNTRVPKTFHASSYVNCVRQQAYGLLGYTPDEGKTVNPGWKRDAAFGESLHGVIQQRLIDSEMVIQLPNFDYEAATRFLARLAGKLSPAVEVPLNEWVLTPERLEELKRYRLGGRVDGILKGTDKPLVLEIKTVAGKYFSPNYHKYYLDKLYHFESQCQIYLHFLELERAVILVINRDNSSFDEYMVTYDSLFVSRELERLEGSAGQVMRMQLPEPEPSRGPCNFCDWRKQCPASETEKNNGGYKHV